MTVDKSAANENLKIERRALGITKWANLFMAFAGVTVSYLSHSDALLVDGLFSLVNFFSAIVAVRIGVKVFYEPNRSRPWGYDFDEAIYVTFRSLVLVGVLGFAAFVSGSKIFTFFTGGHVQELVFGPIAIYAIAIFLICLSLACLQRWAYVKTGRSSSILQTESRAAVIDGFITFGSGAALLSLPFLKDTPLAPYLPIGDAVVVVTLVLVMIWQPLSVFKRTLADLAGVSAPAETVAKASRAGRALAKEHDYKFHRAGVLRAGRMHFAALYLDPQRSVTATEIDTFQEKAKARLEDVIGPTRTEIIITTRSGPLPPDRR